MQGCTDSIYCYTGTVDERLACRTSEVRVALGLEGERAMHMVVLSEEQQQDALSHQLQVKQQLNRLQALLSAQENPSSLCERVVVDDQSAPRTVIIVTIGAVSFIALSGLAASAYLTYLECNQRDERHERRHRRKMRERAREGDKRAASCSSDSSTEPDDVKQVSARKKHRKSKRKHRTDRRKNTVDSLKPLSILASAIAEISHVHLIKSARDEADSRSPAEPKRSHHQQLLLIESSTTTGEASAEAVPAHDCLPSLQGCSLAYGLPKANAAIGLGSCKAEQTSDEHWLEGRKFPNGRRDLAGLGGVEATTGSALGMGFRQGGQAMADILRPRYRCT